ncbi:MAG: tol-pal system-associated acyl-CoA thioesterase [Thioalkalispiraceae bacterium]|jgi:acyl-CoA thioester hydrolase
MRTQKSQSVIEFSWPVRVYYEDTDAGGVVYHTNYLKFMERARTEWLRELGFEQDELKSEYDVIFAVRNVSIDYILPARFNDRLVVSVSVLEQARASLVLEQTIRKENKLGVLCQGQVKVVSLKASSFKPCPLPSNLTQILSELILEKE